MPDALTDEQEMLAAVAAVRAACRDADGHDPLDEAADLRLARRGFQGSDSRVEPDGFAVLHDGDLDLAVHPRSRGTGVGERLAAAVVPASGPVRAWSHGDHPAAARLAVRFGLARARELWVMRHPDAPVAVPEPADGVRLRRFDPEDPADAEGLLRVNAAAFAHHPEQGALDHEGLAERMAQPWFDPKGLVLAVADDASQPDRLLAFHWTKITEDPDHPGERLGEVYVVGVDPTVHGRGLGKLVTAAGLDHLHRAGTREVLLYVEGDNTPAIGLYEGLGFRHDPGDTHVQYRRWPQS